MNFLLLSSYYFFLFASGAIFIIFFPLYLKNSLGFEAIQIGILLSAMPVMKFLIPVLFKKVVITQRIFIYFTLLFFISPLILFFENFYIILLAFILHGAAWGITLPYVETYAVETLQESYGKSRLWGSIGFMLVSIMIPYLSKVEIDNLSFLPSFLAQGVHLLSTHIILQFIILVSIVTVISFKFIKHCSIEVQKDFKPIKLGKEWEFWIALLLMQLAFGGYYNFFSIYCEDHKISTEWIGWFWAIATIAEIIIFIFQDKFFNKFSPIKWIKIAIAVTAARWLILYLFPGNEMITTLSQLAHAFSFAIFHTASIIYVSNRYTNKNLAQQFYAGIGYGLALFLGTIFAGVIYQFIPSSLFLIESLLTFTALFVLWKKH